MAMTTISLDSKVRDRLRTFCGGGKSYSEALTEILDKIEMDAFFDEARRRVDDPEHPWIAEADFEWD